MTGVVWREHPSAAQSDGAVAYVLPLSSASSVEPTSRDLLEAPHGEPLRSAFLARRGLTREIVAARLGVDVGDVLIGHRSSGAPLIVSPPTNLRISIAGRDDFCAIALASRAIGVDIEPIGPVAEPAWNILHESERSFLSKVEPTRRHEAFLRIWTAKEAYLKALGLGLAREPSEIAILPRGGNAFEAPDSGEGSWRRVSLHEAAFMAACVILGE
jgi:phosphopantetheinyl transferase